MVKSDFAKKCGCGFQPRPAKFTGSGQFVDFAGLLIESCIDRSDVNVDGVGGKGRLSCPLANRDKHDHGAPRGIVRWKGVVSFCWQSLDEGRIGLLKLAVLKLAVLKLTDCGIIVFEPNQ
ncbi:hypothetical protein Q31b_10430 [Novipirellula aureliae]|uniref:Uncharacterized protein n=1 Tax=Novipirellula aureliae TaxID=2527966 RepID=A0A5C6ED17_9BACT|nr:hypothetical protein Q31b_10430 [Novipirellula aureliae]